MGFVQNNERQVPKGILLSPRCIILWCQIVGKRNQATVASGNPEGLPANGIGGSIQASMLDLQA